MPLLNRKLIKQKVEELNAICDKKFVSKELSSEDYLDACQMISQWEETQLTLLHLSIEIACTPSK